MMFQECPACGADGVSDDGPYKETCTCDECGAQFRLEADADGDSEGYKDCSTVGDRIDQ